ncbi:hypothetical protein A2801_03585 [Candidatus Woesebacteria bacterium RIFCSPHIGHO2_01_FULL_41_10]|uniref:Diacylglycerol kinase n=1 Tax=Candidatus Woesebacteria bacterium RIFCSPHIGHO2_01_FULL_41_10 TaxID=1802500 RepID=A0A1F7YPB6_9BACT|nr:MAG: hypothetical protein A2801_03585 [Candidatus Woesebacteria bacterium RIFCSPHIGHO2_01_FULL_41_10]
MSRTRKTFRSFQYAFSGFQTALKQEPNLQIHMVVGLGTLVAAFFIGFTSTEWVILFFTISFVITMELFNTGIEALVDMVSPDIHPKAKIAKDVSAAAVLVAAVMSVIVGILLFIPKIQR